MPLLWSLVIGLGLCFYIHGAPNGAWALRRWTLEVRVASVDIFAPIFLPGRPPVRCPVVSVLAAPYMQL
jgi:hypothetical protein